MRATLPLLLGALLLSTTLALAVNATPFINQPLIPASIAPGGPDFTLTVNGTGFVSGSTVNWNGSPRTTTFVNASQLTATILAADIATANTGSVTVTSPAPGGGTSNLVFMPVHQSSTFVSFNSSTLFPKGKPSVITVGDFNHDGNLDMAIGTAQQTSSGVGIWLGHGDGTFALRSEYSIGTPLQLSLTSADINQDGNVDLIVTVPNNSVLAFWVLLGRGDGRFAAPVIYATAKSPEQTMVADFNHDGHPDAAFVSLDGYCMALGVGDGTFQATTCQHVKSNGHIALGIGDFNLDGNLDLVLTKSGLNGLNILLGNGDGTFQIGPPQPPGNQFGVVVADVDGDGKLDLTSLGGARSAFYILHGNGDGTFTRTGKFLIGPSPNVELAGDLNADGKLDVITANYTFDAQALSVALGNGGGNFEGAKSYPNLTANPFITNSSAIGDFNNDGRLDIANTSFDRKAVVISLQDDGTAVSFSPAELKFPSQLVGQISDPKPVILTNNGTAPLNVKKVSPDPAGNFSQFSNCSTVQPGDSCRIAVSFTPTTIGHLVAYLTVQDNGGGSPQVVPLSGYATVVSLTPDKLDFGSLPVQQISPPQAVIVKNEGPTAINITEIGIGGDNPEDFLQENACPPQLGSGQSCTINVIFHPRSPGAKSAILGVKDNGGSSPQKVSLSGTGTEGGHQ